MPVAIRSPFQSPVPPPTEDGMPKQILFDADARAAIRRGVEKVAHAVRPTLGPRGRTVVIEKSWGAPTITKDGASVAEEVELRDPFENMGAQLVREAAKKTSDDAGDGTTTSTVLAEALYLRSEERRVGKECRSRR